MPINQQAYIQAQRIRQICAFLSAGGGRLQEMHDQVNRGLEQAGLSAIGLRTLQSCVEQLRKGDFDHSQKDLPAKSRSKLFKVEYRNRTYRWASGSAFPQFGDLDEEERYTLPFLAGILRRFESIPAVQKILYQLPELFNITESEMESRMAIYQPGPVLYDPQDPGFEAKVIRCVINILSFIHRQQAIEFNYTSVNVYDSKIENLTLRQVAPLHIRFYEHFYYLTASDLDDGRIHNYRIDHIHRLQVSALEDEQGLIQEFDRERLIKKTAIPSRYRESLGVWIHPDEDKLYEIHVAFYRWAASYVKRLQLHPSQQTLREDKARQTLVVSLRLRLCRASPEKPDIIDRNQELSFLLGRFRNDCEILAAKPTR